MDAAISSVLQAKQSSLESQIQSSVARKSLDMTRLVGEGLVQMLEATAQLGKAVGAGEQFDALG